MPSMLPRVLRTHPATVPTGLALLASLALLGGCTQPSAALKQPTLQQSAVSLHDWQTAANRVVQGMADQGIIPGGFLPAAQPGEPPPTPMLQPMPGPFYINVLVQGSTFLEEVKQSMETELLRRGVEVARIPSGATVINLDVDVVHWGGTHYVGGTLTALGAATGAGAAIASTSPIGAAGGALVALGAGMAADVGLSAYPMTDAEAVWRATIVAKDRVILRASEVIYIAAADIPLYRGSVTLAEMNTPGSSAFGSPRQLRYAP